ncbi:MAG: hypothetical protein ACT4QD_22035 [Acidobacteriota bacterium]
MSVWAATLAVPTSTLVGAVLAFSAHHRGASRRLTGYALVVSLAMGAITMYLWSHDLIGVRMWAW